MLCVCYHDIKATFKGAYQGLTGRARGQRVPLWGSPPLGHRARITLSHRSAYSHLFCPLPPPTPPFGGASHGSLHGSALGSCSTRHKRKVRGRGSTYTSGPCLPACLPRRVRPRESLVPTRPPDSFRAVRPDPCGLSDSARGPRRSRLPVPAPVGSQSSRQLRSFCLSPPYGKGETPPPLSIFWKLQHHLFLSCLISCPSLQPGQCWGAPSPKSRGTRLLSGPSPVCTSCPSLQSFLYLLLSPNATPVSVVSC